MATAPELYPLSTQDGQSIPLEIVKATKTLFYNLLLSTSRSGTIPAGISTAYLFSTCECLINLGGAAWVAPVEDTAYADTLYLPANILLAVMLTPGSINIWPLGSGKLYICSIQQWAALAQAQQSRVQ